MAAIRPGTGSGQRSSGGGKRGGSWRGKKKGGHGGGGGQQVSHTLSHAEQARIGSGLCFSHFCYGSKAGSVRPPAPGRETRWPGAAQRRRRRAADSHDGSGFQQAFPRGHWSFLQHPSTSLFSTCLGPEAVWASGSAYTLLGRTPDAASIPGSRFLLEISFSRCSFPHFGCDFLRAHKMLIDPVGHALLDSKGRRLAGQLLRSPPTATVVIGFVQPYIPVAETSSPSAHTAGAVSAGAASAGTASAGTASAGPVSAASSPSAHTAGAASAGVASAGAASARPVSAAGERAASADVNCPPGCPLPP